MAKEKAKNGFFFYFGFFLLVLIAAVLVIFVVMLFMPGKSILWLEYFSNSETTFIQNTTAQEAGGETEEIDFENPNFSKVEVNAGYSQVYIQKNFEHKKTGIYIINESKGFVTSKNARDFSYNVTIEDDTLKLTVKEQPAFLYFSKDIKIIFQIAKSDISPFEKMDVTINNDGGLVNIGGPNIKGQSLPVYLKSLTVNNERGDIMISSMGDSEYEKLSLTSASGDITINQPTVTATSMDVNVGSGTFTASVINNTLNLTSNKGTVDVVSVKDRLVGNIKNAYVTIGDVANGADFSNSEFSSSVLKIGSIGQGGITAPNARGTDFELGDVNGVVRIDTTTGSVSIDGKIQQDSQIKTGSGNISVKISEVVSPNKTAGSVETEKGTINITIPELTNFGRIITVSNDRGDTNVTMDLDGVYNVYFYRYADAETEANRLEFKFTNVTLNRELALKNPLRINTRTDENILVLKCNKNIVFNWA